MDDKNTLVHFKMKIELFVLFYYLLFSVLVDYTTYMDITVVKGVYYNYI